MDLKAWKKHRNRLNKKYRSVKIDLSDLRIVKVSNTSASVRFKQHYLADGYKDVGIKKIHLQKKGKRWQIKKEEWLPLGGKSRL
jgi:hypothetical protein